MEDGYSAVRHAPVVVLRGQAVGCVGAEDGTSAVRHAPIGSETHANAPGWLICIYLEYCLDRSHPHVRQVLSCLFRTEKKKRLPFSGQPERLSACLTPTTR